MENWLNDVLRQYRYRHPPAVERDVLSLLNTYRSLRPRVEKYVHANGSESMLLQLYGTVPIIYKGQQYNIPVHVWVRDTHPEAPPMIYVVPTHDMLVRAGRHVDTNGCVYLPELHNWMGNDANRTSNLLAVAGRMCQVFGQEPPVYAKSNAGGGGGGGGMPSASMYGGSDMGANGGGGGNRQSGFDARGVYGVGGMGMMMGGMSEEERKRKEEADREAAERKIMYESMVSAVTDKLSRQYRQYGELTTEAINEQFRVEAELKSGTKTLEEMMQQIEKDKEQAEMDKTVLVRKTAEIDETMVKLQGHKELDVDAAVTSSTPLYNQLLDLVAEDHALSDALYYLGRALNNQVIDLPTYLKHVRQLARKQFIAKATIMKARQTAGLKTKLV
eukprot:Nk52_evm53s2367 gene=Nk52_evmTU53s2367